jgi:MoaA/NifB/PqqE/SkfB family radical SAM enzyme
MSAEPAAIVTNTLVGNGADDELQKVQSHEDAAHEKRNWVRLTYDCNNHCTFCLDTLAHNGTMRSTMDIKVQIVEGRRKGASRLILSGGEPTMHPNFLDFVKLGKRAGYPKVQTVTNGRMFAYPEFLETAAQNGLDEITFSLHGHTPKLHDALVGTPGAFEQETRGLKAALASGRFIVNVDIVINKQNVKHLPEMLELFISWGVREFDLLHIIPFGNAWGSAREHLFYDLAGNEEPIRRALEYSKRPDLHIWLNRFPPEFTEGFEELIQDPYKMNDEVRGRREEYDKYLAIGQKLHCREPERCHYCYLNQLCDELDVAIEGRAALRVDVLRVVHPPPLAGELPETRALQVVAHDVTLVRDVLSRVPHREALYLELDDLTGLDAALDADDRLHGVPVERVYASRGADVDALLALPRRFSVTAYARRDNEAAILRHRHDPRLRVAQPNYERVTDQLEHDLDLRGLFRQLPPSVASENVPACLGGREPERVERSLDAATLGADARLDMGRFAQRYIADRYYTKSRRCSGCVHDARCDGVHLNYVRAHRYATLSPIAPDAE